MVIFAFWAVFLAVGAPFSAAPLQIKTYRLAGIVQGADFDLKALREIDSLPVPYPPGSGSQVSEIPLVRGKSLIFKFVAAYPGTSAEGGTAEFHDLLVLRIGCGDEILDAWQYTREWADAPSLDLNRMGRKGLVLKKGFDVASLGLVNAATGKAAGEEGLIE